MRFTMITPSGKVALVTGEISGIGRATTSMLAQARANVVVAGRRQAEGEETIRQIQAVQALVEKMTARYRSVAKGKDSPCT